MSRGQQPCRNMKSKEYNFFKNGDKLVELQIFCSKNNMGWSSRLENNNYICEPHALTLEQKQLIDEFVKNILTN